MAYQIHCIFAILLVLLVDPNIIHSQHAFKPKNIDSFDYKNSRIWGPGLKPEKIVLPVRFFFIEAVRFDKKPLGYALLTPFEVKITGKSEFGPCRTRIELLDRKDGSYIARYKVLQKCWSVQIHVTHRGRNVAKSPYQISSTVYSDKCNCPQSMDKWLLNNKCEPKYEQIKSDLHPFSRILMSDVRRKVSKAFENRIKTIALCNYVILNNRIYRTCFGEYVGFNMFMDNLLQSLVKWVKLPDTEFYVNLGDWPLAQKARISRVTGPLPIFSWCGSNDTFDIVMPTYELTESSLEAMERITIDVLSVQNTRTKWDQKETMAFWRGRDSRRERLKLIDISRAYPDMINASITNFHFYKDQEVNYGPAVKAVSFFEFLNSKYQLNIDGTVAAYRLPYLLASNALVLKQASSFYEHYYSDLEPYYHYVPFNHNLSDLANRIEWAIHNDYTAQRIARQSQEFVNDHLTSDKVFCYFVQLINEWTKRLVEPIALPIWENKTEVPIRSDDSCKCEPWTEVHDEL